MVVKSQNKWHSVRSKGIPVGGSGVLAWCAVVCRCAWCACLAFLSLLSLYRDKAFGSVKTPAGVKCLLLRPSRAAIRQQAAQVLVFTYLHVSFTDYYGHGIRY